MPLSVTFSFTSTDRRVVVDKIDAAGNSTGKTIFEPAEQSRSETRTISEGEVLAVTTLEVVKPIEGDPAVAEDTIDGGASVKGGIGNDTVA